MAHVKLLKQDFDSLDKNNDRKLNLKEITEFLEAFGFKKAQAKRFMKKYDADGDKEISREEFCSAVDNIKPKEVNEAKLRKVFRRADKDKSGKISAEELKNHLSKHNNEVSSEEVDAWISDHDKDNDGNLDYEEFIDFIKERL